MIPDKEKVIKGLECCQKESEWYREPCCECPYGAKYGAKGGGCIDRLLADTIALLKEQEAKQVIKQTYHIMMNRDYENPVDVTRYEWLCPTCGSLLCRDIDVIDDNYHFCKVCGQAVIWE